MTDVVLRVCVEGIKNENSHITEAELREKFQERIMYQKRRHPEV